MTDRTEVAALVERLRRLPAYWVDTRLGKETADTITALQARLDAYELAALEAAYAGTLNHQGIRADYEAKRREVTG